MKLLRSTRISLYSPDAWERMGRPCPKGGRGLRRRRGEPPGVKKEKEFSISYNYSPELCFISILSKFALEINYLMQIDRPFSIVKLALT